MPECEVGKAKVQRRRREDATAKREEAKVGRRMNNTLIMPSQLRTLTFALSPLPFYVCGALYCLKIILAV